MRTKRTKLLTFAAVTLAAGAFIAADVAAEVHFNATVHTPGVSIHVGNAPAGYRVARHIRPLPARGRIDRIAGHDNQVAHRLAWYTGMPAGELLKYRRYGYDWFEIGQWLSVPGRVVRAAMRERDWNHFLREHGYREGFNGGHRHGGRG